MNELGIIPECECFDTGIVRLIALFQQVGLLRAGPCLVGHAVWPAGMPAKAEWLPLLVAELPKDAHFQTIPDRSRGDLAGASSILQELGGHLRTGVEDTFYPPDGSRPTQRSADRAGARRSRFAVVKPATAAEARAMIGVTALPHGVATRSGPYVACPGALSGLVSVAAGPSGPMPSSSVCRPDLLIFEPARGTRCITRGLVLVGVLVWRSELPGRFGGAAAARRRRLSCFGTLLFQDRFTSWR